MGQVLNIDAPRESVEQYPRARNVEFGYGGFLIGYHVAPESRLHGVISVLVGGGGFVLSDRDVNEDDDPDVGHDGDGVFVMEPELALEANLLRFMRLQFALSYRSVWDVDLAGLDDADASGIGGGVAGETPASFEACVRTARSASDSVKMRRPARPRPHWCNPRRALRPGLARKRCSTPRT
jgi:hypothetical protein